MDTLSPAPPPAMPDAAHSAALYASRRRVYPRKVTGPWRRVKWTVLALCLGLYYGGAWLRWDRGPAAPDQAFLIDLAGGRAWFLDLEIWPQEVYYLTGLLILAAIGLFLVTSLFGRVWCGYACPQTVWTDLFMLVERWIEGDRNARIRRDNAPPTARRAALKLVKHALWLLIAVATGGAWVWYFNDAPTITAAFFDGSAGSGVYFFVALFSATTYLLAGWAREQVCTYMCPWPRFQAAMFDEHSFTVAYRAWRGEPRGALRKGPPGGTSDARGTSGARGDCIDCKACLHVCPTGIDIRNGAQLQCISCGLCVDACNAIMDRISRPRDLIAWTTLAADAAAAERRRPVYRLLRPRTAIYGTILLLVAGVMIAAFGLRAEFEINVIRERSPQFVLLSDGAIRNGYTIKILNKTRDEAPLTLRLEGPAGAQWALADGPLTSAPLALAAAADSVATLALHVRLPRSALHEELSPLEFVVERGGRSVARRRSVFAAPGKP